MSRAALLLIALLLFAAPSVVVSQQAPLPNTPALERLTVPSDGHPMAVWARRPSVSRGAVLLVHGRTWSSRPDFDLQVPGLKRSVMVALAARGIAAYAVDLRGYGETPRDRTGWSTPRQSALDVVNVLMWIAAQHPTSPVPAVVGWSRGAAIAMLAAQMSPTRVSSLTLFGFAYDPNAAFADTIAPGQPMRARNTAASAASDFISPRVTPRAVVQAFVAEAVRTDPVLVDVKDDVEFNALNPAKIAVPTLVIFGSRDPGVMRDDASKFVARLGTTDKQLVVLQGADHAAHLEDTHEAWMAAVIGVVNRGFARR